MPHYPDTDRIVAPGTLASAYVLEEIREFINASSFTPDEANHTINKLMDHLVEAKAVINYLLQFRRLTSVVWPGMPHPSWPVAPYTHNTSVLRRERTKRYSYEIHDVRVHQVVVTEGHPEFQEIALFMGAIAVNSKGKEFYVRSSSAVSINFLYRGWIPSRWDEVSAAEGGVEIRPYPMLPAVNEDLFAGLLAQITREMTIDPNPMFKWKDD